MDTIALPVFTPLSESKPNARLTDLPALGMNAGALAKDFQRYFIYTLGRDENCRTTHYPYKALALSLRDRLMERWKDTDQAYAAARSCLAEAQETPDVPALLAGDTNVVLEGHPLEPLFAQHVWHNPLRGHRTSDLSDRRIDWLLYNRAAGWRVGLPRVDWSWKFPVHAVQWVTLPGEPPRKVPRWQRAVLLR